MGDKLNIEFTQIQLEIIGYKTDQCVSSDLHETKEKISFHDDESWKAATELRLIASGFSVGKTLYYFFGEKSYIHIRDGIFGRHKILACLEQSRREVIASMQTEESKPSNDAITSLGDTARPKRDTGETR